MIKIGEVKIKMYPNINMSYDKKYGLRLNL